MDLVVAGPLAPTGVFAAAGFLRLFGLDAVGFNSDEAVYAGQAAAIVGDPGLTQIFPVFRAHPLLVQTALALSFSLTGVSDLIGRLVSVASGVGAVAIVMWLGWRIYGRRTGLLAGLLVALMPYHIVVSRQTLLDAPMTLFATLALALLALYPPSTRTAWLVAAGAALGLAFLAKETAIILLSAVFAFFALSPEVRIRLRDFAAGLLAFAVVAAAFPLALVLAGGGGSQSASQYLLWQFFRRPNHDLLFYPSVVPPAIGPLVLLAALGALWVARRRLGWPEKLLGIWIVVPVVFFELWPTKGFQYLLPIVPAVAILAARLLVHDPPTAALRVGRFMPHVRQYAIALVAVSLLVPSLVLATAQPSDAHLAGAGGVPAGREAGRWLRAESDPNARLMTIGPTMLNILGFYGHRDAQALSVSPNPLRRNPSYEPIRNPDRALREGTFDYLIWDAFSAGRSPHFAGRLLEYVRRFNAELVATFPEVGEPLIRIYKPAPIDDATRGERPLRIRPRTEIIEMVYLAAVVLTLLTILVAARARRSHLAAAVCLARGHLDGSVCRRCGRVVT